MLSDRLKKKIQQACCKNILPLVIVDWLLNGSVKDREDVYSIIYDLEHTTEILNGIYGQIHNKIDSTQVMDDIYKDLKKVLSQKDKYGKLDTKNRIYVETRGWIIPILSKCSINNLEDCKKILSKYLNEEVDPQTQFWAFYSYISNNNISKEDITNKVDEIFKLYNDQNEYNELYWCSLIYYLNETEADNDKHTMAKTKINELLNNYDLNMTHLKFFSTLSYYRTPHIVRELIDFFEFIVKIDIDGFLNSCHINLYKYIVTCVSDLGKKEYKLTLSEAQNSFGYLLFRFLNVLRNYSGRIWNEVRLQILRGLRIYFRTNGKKIIDNLKEEILLYDLSVTCEACKTLNIVYGTKVCTKVIIEILTNEKKKNPILDEKILIAVSYGMKIIGTKNNNIFNILDDILSNSHKYEEKNITRILLTEMGGFTAINKLKENQDLREKYMQMTGNAQDKVESMFHTSITDAKNAFKISLYMNVTVFLIGMCLLSVSGFIAIFNDDEENWAGIGVSSGTGFLGVIYSLFINKPSRKIRKSTNHLMRLKVIFLGYLRELTQMDQTFSKQLLDPEPISQNTLLQYVSKINSAMNSALKALRWEEYLNLDDDNIDQRVNDLDNLEITDEVVDTNSNSNSISNNDSIINFQTLDVTEL